MRGSAHGGSSRIYLWSKISDARVPLGLMVAPCVGSNRRNEKLHAVKKKCACSVSSILPFHSVQGIRRELKHVNADIIQRKNEGQNP